MQIPSDRNTQDLRLFFYAIYVLKTWYDGK